MHLLVYAVIFGILAGATNASPASTKLWDSKHPGKCVYKDQVISPGESIRPTGECGVINCISENRASMGFCTKNVKRIPKNCKLGEFVDKSKPYPECCEMHLIC